MPAGLTVWFETGAFQVDSEIRTATLSYKETYSGPFAYEERPFVALDYYFDVVLPAGTSSVFFSSDTQVIICLWSRVGNTWRFKIGAQVPVTIYAFADKEIAPSSSGLQLFSSAGVLTFDSDSPFLRITNIVRGAPSGTTINLPADGRKYAAGIGNYPKRTRGAAMAGLPFWVQMCFGVSIGPTQVSVGETSISSRQVGGGGDPPPTDSPAMAPPTMMIIDVTGY